MRVRNNATVRGATLIWAGVWLAGCASAPPSQREQLDLETPSEFSAATEGSRSELNGWLGAFDSPALDGLVDEALERNASFEAAAYRLRAARSTARATRSVLWPQISGGYRASQNKRATNTGFVINNPVAENLGLTSSLVWEVDLWGKFSNRARAAIADVQATEAELRGARLSLAAQTARAYFDAVEARLQTELAQRNQETFEANVALVEEGALRGVFRALDVRLTRANLADAQSSVGARRRQLDAALRSLEVLLGRYPEADVALADTLPSLDSPPPAGLVSDLLQRRPDLIAAERRLAAAWQRRKEASKDRLPTLSLTASGGTSTPQLRESLDPESNIWSFAANLTGPLFEGGRRAAVFQQRKAEAEAALSDYRETALQALREVESALAAEVFLREQNSALDRAVEESAEADALAWQEYQRGISDIVTALESRRRAVNAESARIQIRNLRLQNRLDLYLALGGSFTDQEFETH